MSHHVGLALLVALTTVAGCSGKDAPTVATTNSPTVTITIENATEQYAPVTSPISCPVFSPNPATITTTQQLLFKNEGLASTDIYVSGAPGTPNFQSTGAIAADSTGSAGSFTYTGTYYFWTSACALGVYGVLNVTVAPASGQ